MLCIGSAIEEQETTNLNCIYIICNWAKLLL